MRRLLFGVIGHVDHGKTALVRALTGTDTDRLPEEKRRGISIALGFAHFRVGDAEIDLIDMPGHERFVRTMIAGATGMDAVLVVIAANEGIKPQTIEHLEIAALLGVRRAVIAVTKSDTVDRETAATTASVSARLVARTGFEAGPPTITSATIGEGIEALRTDLIACAQAEGRRDDGFCWLPIDRSFSIAGFGTVVTGTLRRGRIAVGDQLFLLPGEKAVRVRGLQVHGSAVASAEPGMRIAANLRSVQATDLGRGLALATPGCLAATPWLSVSVRCLDSASEPLRNGARLTLLFGTAEQEVRLRLLNADELQPGQIASAQISCKAPVFVPVGEHFVLRTISPPRAVAGGRIIETVGRRLRRHDPVVLKRLARLAASGQDAVLEGELREVGALGVPLPQLARLAGLSLSLATARLPSAAAILTRGGTAVTSAAMSDIVEAVPKALAGARVPPGIDLLRTIVPMPVSGEVLEEALHRLAAKGMVRQSGGAWHLVQVQQENRQRQRESELAQQLAEMLRRAGLSPPGQEEILAAHPEARHALAILRQAGVLVLTFDRVQKRQILFHCEALAEARRKLAPLLGRPPGLLVKEAGAALGISRKYSVPLLEYFDAVQYTRRHGDRRMLLHPEES